MCAEIAAYGNRRCSSKAKVCFSKPKPLRPQPQSKSIVHLNFRRKSPEVPNCDRVRERRRECLWKPHCCLKRKTSDFRCIGVVTERHLARRGSGKSFYSETEQIQS